MREHLRPIERRVLALSEAGHDASEIGRRVRRSAAHVERIIDLTNVPRSGPAPRRSPRPIEKRVLALLDQGESHDQIASRFKRSPSFIRRVEGLAYYRRARHLLTER